MGLRVQSVFVSNYNYTYMDLYEFTFKVTPSSMYALTCNYEVATLLVALSPIDVVQYVEEIKNAKKDIEQIQTGLVQISST